jgi:hypothetical protein
MNRKKNASLLAGLAVTACLLAALAVAFAGNGTAASQAAPANQTPPTLSGTPEVGKTLTANTGNWTGTAPITFVYRFQRCDKDGGDCFTGGSTALKTYVVTPTDVGKTIRVRVTATNAEGSANATSVPSAVVRAAAAPAPPTPPATPTGCAGNAPIQIANVKAPDRLTVDGQMINPTIVGRSTGSLTLRFHVSCKGKAVQGALVYATAVPFNQFRVPAEQPTGADGWAQLTTTQLSGFPAADKQELLVVFVRARKGGEDPLGGVSSRRLVSFPVDLRR